MTISRQTQRWLATALGATLLAVTGAAHAQYQDRNIRASIVLGKGHSLSQALAQVSQCAAEKSAGKMKIQPFYDGALGGDLAAIQQLRSGTLEMMVTSPSYMSGMVPSAAVFDLPFYFTNEKEIDAALDGKAGALLADRLMGSGLVTLAYYDLGFRHVTNSKHPIKRLEDFNGLKVRGMQNPVVLDTFKALGGFAVAMPYSEAYSALENKTVDGQENAAGLIEISKFNEVQKYLSNTGHMYTATMLAYSKQLFDKLSPQEQATLRECAVTARDVQRRVNRQQTVESIARMKASGLVVNDISADEMVRLRAAAAPVQANLLRAIGPEMVTAVQDDLKRVRGR